MYFSNFSTVQKKDFHLMLKGLPADDNFGKIKSYYNYLNDNKDGHDTVERSIDDRIETARYFYLPGEATSPVDMNCFEKSAAIYLAVQAVYPESDPKLLILDEGKRGIHGCVLLRHDGKTYGIDPNYSICEPIILERNKISVISDDGNIKERLNFKSFTEMKPEALENKISRLRSASGIVEFFTGAGQIVKVNKESVFPQYAFINVDGEGNIKTEIRRTNFDPMLNVCTRFRGYVDDKTVKGQTLRYVVDNWNHLKGEVTLVDSTPRDVRDKSDKNSHFFPHTYDTLESGLAMDMFLHSSYMHNLKLKLKRKERKRSKISPKGFFLNSNDELEKFEEKLRKGGNIGLLKWSLSYSEDFKNRVLDYALFKPQFELGKLELGHKLNEEMLSIFPTSESLVNTFLFNMQMLVDEINLNEVRPYCRALAYELGLSKSKR